MKAKKSLGQHFLKSDSALRKIAEAVSIKSAEVVVEIGPGHGELTVKLLSEGAKVIAVEKDEALVSKLQEAFKEEIRSSQLKLIRSDVRDLSAKDILPKDTARYKLVGNIPYYITGFLLRSFLSQDPRPERVVFLVQKEVAERVARSKKESLLSLSIKAYGDPKYIATVKAGSFSPPPKVDSAILAIENITNPFNDSREEKLFFEVLRAGFSQKRKTLFGNLSKRFDKKTMGSVFEKCGLDRRVRAEDIHLEKWLRLVSSIKENTPSVFEV